MVKALLPLPPQLPDFRQQLHLDDVAVLVPGLQNYVDAEWRVLYSDALNALLRAELPFFDFTALEPGSKKFRHFCQVIGNIDTATDEYHHANHSAQRAMAEYRETMTTAARGDRLSFMQEAYARTRLVGTVARAFGKFRVLYTEARRTL